MPDDKVSIRVLQECVDLQQKKSADYQSTFSDVKQADYYRLGIDSIYDMMHTKMLRLRSLMEKAKNDPTSAGPTFESLEDTAKDLINYSSFFAAYIRGGVDGQDPARDMFNRLKPKYINSEIPEGPKLSGVSGVAHSPIDASFKPSDPSIGSLLETKIRRGPIYTGPDFQQ